MSKCLYSKKNMLTKRKKRWKKQLQLQQFGTNKRLKVNENNHKNKVYCLQQLMRQQLSLQHEHRQPKQKQPNTLKLLSEKLLVKWYSFDWSAWTNIRCWLNNSIKNKAKETRQKFQRKFCHHNGVNCVNEMATKTTRSMIDLRPTTIKTKSLCATTTRVKSEIHSCSLRCKKVFACHWGNLCPHISTFLRYMTFVLIFLAPNICHNNVYTTYAASISPQESSSALNILEALEYEQKRNNLVLEYKSNNNNTQLRKLSSTYVEHLDNRTLRSYSIIDENSLSLDHMEAIEREAAAKITEPIFDFGMPRNITARTGQGEAVIKCRVDALNDKSVSWIRKRDLHILSVGTATYTSDKRFEVTGSKDQREWSLHVKAPQSRDSGIYECQINTEPKISMAFQLNIIEISPDAKAIINGPADLHFKVGSAIILSCYVQQPSVKDIGPIYWYRGEHMITPFTDFEDFADTHANEQLKINMNAGTPIPVAVETATQSMEDAKRLQDSLNEITQDFTTRIAMESQLGDTLKSRLRISNAQTTDTGNYTCQPTTASSASVMVHVINDENPAAMQKSAAVALQCFHATLLSDCITTLVAIKVMLVAFVLQHFKLVIKTTTTTTATSTPTIKISNRVNEASCLTTQKAALAR